MRLSLVATAALVLALPARDARACSPIPCVPYDYAPSSGTIPSSAPALGVRASMIGSLAAEDLSLVGPAGEALSFKLGEVDTKGFQSITPASQLAPGDGYLLKVLERCPAMGGDGTSRAVPFSVAPAAELPSALGSLQVSAPHAIDQIVIPGGPACFENGKGVGVEFTVTLAPSITPWWPLVELQLELDGHPVATEKHGFPVPQNGVITEPPTSNRQTSVLRVTRLCTGSDADEAGARVAPPAPTSTLAAGQHNARGVARTFGDRRVLETNAVSFELFCPGEEPTDGPLQGTVNDDETTRESGCSTGGFAGLALVALAVRRRRS